MGWREYSILILDCSNFINQQEYSWLGPWKSFSIIIIIIILLQIKFEIKTGSSSNNNGSRAGFAFFFWVMDRFSFNYYHELEHVPRTIDYLQDYF